MVTHMSRFYSAISHYIGTLIQVVRASSRVFSYTFELPVSLKCKVYCYYVENYKSTYYPYHKSWRFLYEPPCAVWVSLLSLFFALLGFALFVTVFVAVVSTVAVIPTISVVPTIVPAISPAIQLRNHTGSLGPLVD